MGRNTMNAKVCASCERLFTGASRPRWWIGTDFKVKGIFHTTCCSGVAESWIWTWPAASTTPEESRYRCWLLNQAPDLYVRLLACDANPGQPVTERQEIRLLWWQHGSNGLTAESVAELRAEMQRLHAAYAEFISQTPLRPATSV